ncbi:MAG: hypothetical protein ISS77_00605 [Phycisphaerae bacterium]|nr:hypothetical protein [Phycisphaerae bacterium]
MLKSKIKIFNKTRKITAGGFSMVEIIIAMTIMATSLLAVFGVLSMCIRASNSNTNIAGAAILAESLLNEKRLEKNISYETTKGKESKFNWQIQVSPTEIDNLVAVAVKISWLQNQIPKEYQLISVMHIPAVLQGK